jgi:hypothetical protein
MLETHFFRARSEQISRAQQEAQSAKHPLLTVQQPAIYVSAPDNTGGSGVLSHKRQLREDANTAQQTDEWAALAALDPASLHASVTARTESENGIKSDAVRRLLTSSQDVDIAITGVPGEHTIAPHHKPHRARSTHTRAHAPSSSSNRAQPTPTSGRRHLLIGSSHRAANAHIGTAPHTLITRETPARSAAYTQCTHSVHTVPRHTRRPSIATAKPAHIGRHIV